jgi:hypothetical protein
MEGADELALTFGDGVEGFMNLLALFAYNF